jgi:hypothetical protein
MNQEIIKKDKLLKKIKQLKNKLNEEAKKYYSKDKSTIGNRILNYQICLTLIELLIEKNVFNPIYLVFKKYSLNAKDLLKCFKEKNDKKEISLIYKKICLIMIENLNKINEREEESEKSVVKELKKDRQNMISLL